MTNKGFGRSQSHPTEYGDIPRSPRQKRTEKKSGHTHRVTTKQGSYSGANGHLACREIPSLSGPRRFITVVTRTCHLTLSSITDIQSTDSHSISYRFTLILSSDISTWLYRTLPSEFARQFVCMLPRFRECYMPHPSYPLLDKPWNIWWNKLWSSSLLNFWLIFSRAFLNSLYRSYGSRLIPIGWFCNPWNESQGSIKHIMFLLQCNVASL